MKHYKRGFLNKGEGMAAFEADIYYNVDTEEYKSVYGNFAITDCSRKISLDFYASNLEDVDNNMFKIDTLLAELQDFRNKLVDGYNSANFKEKESE